MPRIKLGGRDWVAAVGGVSSELRDEGQGSSHSKAEPSLRVVGRARTGAQGRNQLGRSGTES